MNPCLVSTAEKLCYIEPEIRIKGAGFAVFPAPTGPEKNASQPASLLLQPFFSGASIGSPLSRTRSGECLAITNRTQRESQLDFCFHSALLFPRRAFLGTSDETSYNKLPGSQGLHFYE